MFSLPSTLQIGVLLFVVYWVCRQITFYLNPLRKLPYLPGPPPRDFISGNARDIPPDHLCSTFTDWARKYGSVISVRAFNQNMVVISSVDKAIELLDKRSNNYSDRPFIPMTDLMGWTFGTGFKPYGPVWHAHRRIFQQSFKSSTSLEYRMIQTEKTHDLLTSFLEDPEDFMTHIKTLATAIIMEITYGYKVAPKDDPFQILAEEAMGALSEATYPGAALVNILPFLRVIPAWFPGARFQRWALETKVLVTRLVNFPYEYVLTSLAAGTASPCLVANLLENCKTEEDIQLLKDVSAGGYAAGADTSAAVLVCFMYAMATHPEAQKKAQAEIDKVVGTERLPTFDDEASLPYIQAMCREVVRWKPVAPLAIFHATSADDVYNGCYIPAGTTVVPNIWAMSRDPSKYKDPDEFNPDRFFNANNELNDDDVSYVFGFGRRICPGRHLASATIFLAIATILSTFDIRPPKDAAGQDMSLADVKYVEGLVSHVEDFKCTITPRSNKRKQLIVDLSDSR